MDLRKIFGFRHTENTQKTDNERKWDNALKKLSREALWKELREKAQEQLDIMSADDPRAGLVWKYLYKGLLHGYVLEQYDVMFEKYAAGKFAGNVFFLVCIDSNDIPRSGIILGDQFKRGASRGNAGRKASCKERDRAQLLALMSAQIPQAEKTVPEIRAKFFLGMAKLLLQGRKSGSSFKLQTLTDLSKLPDYDTSEGHVTALSRPPVTPDGTPVFYRMPASWDSAVNDGERLRYVIKLADSEDAENLWAEFLCGQFDFLAASEQSRREYCMTPAMKQILYDLKDNETIADLADGIHRITLPDEFNYIGMYKKMADHHTLAKIYSARMQLEKAAEEFDQCKIKSNRKYAEMIRSSRGTVDDDLDHLHVFPAGTELTIPYRYRNAKKVTVKLYRIKTEKAVDSMLKSMKKMDTDPYDIFSAGSYKGRGPEKILVFDLDPLPHHWETTEYLEFGKLNPGAFMAEFIPDDNGDSLFRTIIWASDYALTSCSGAMDGKTRIFVNDPVSGKPVPDIQLKLYSFFAVREKNRITQNVLTLQTDKNGMAEYSTDVFDLPPGSYYVSGYFIAETPAGKLTVLENFEHFRRHNSMEQDKARLMFMITDKPVYKPGDTIAFTGYLRQPSCSGSFDRFEEETVTLFFHDPQYNKAFTKEIPFDKKTQSFTFEMKLSDDIMLGVWHAEFEDFSGSTAFVVEEYKKPEFMLSVIPPGKPVKAGEKMPVVMEAEYYFGAPVPDAGISYKVFREEATEIIPFAFIWNWLYGDEYALCTTSFQEEEEQEVNVGEVLILDAKGRTDANGRLVFEIDTEQAVAELGKKDFRYIIKAEAKDSANRIVSGSGSVIAAVKPFQIFIYMPWGFAKTGTRQQVEIAARTQNGEPVKGNGTLRIFHRTRNKDGVSVRTGEALKIIPFVSGSTDNKPDFVLNEEGVYELEAEVVSEEGIRITKSVPFFVAGEKQNDRLFSGYPLSISCDKPAYRPGDTAELLVSCSKPGRTVYLITRSEREAQIQCVTLDGCSRMFHIPVKEDDQPDFFVKVMSCQDGKMLTLEKEIAVPPEKKILRVTAQPVADKVKPGTTLPLKIFVTDHEGLPVSANATVAVYDKSLESVHESEIPQICTFFRNRTRQDDLYIRNNFEQRIFSEELENWRNIEKCFCIPFRNDEYSMCSPTDGIMYDCAPSYDMELGGCAEIGTAPGRKKKNRPSIPENKTVERMIRTNFLDRAFWAGRIDLPESGETTVNIPVPDNLTTWVIRVWSLTTDTRAGEARTEFTVSKDLIARLELPRFMVQGDTVNAVVSVNNTTSVDIGEVETCLNAPGLMESVYRKKVMPGAGGTASYEVPLTANQAGEYILTLSARADHGESDALELKLPVLVKGIDKQVNTCGRLDAEKSKAVITLDIPEKRHPETTAFALFLSPGAAKNIVELLPYTAADDSNDIFSIVNRFVPAVSAKTALQKSGIPWKNVVPETARAPLYAEYMRCCRNGKTVPPFNAGDFDRITAESLRKIEETVNPDGGWDWFGGYGSESRPDTTAYVVDALLDIHDKRYCKLAEGGADWVKHYAHKRIKDIQKHGTADSTDCFVVRVLAKAGSANEELMNLCYKHRSTLSPYGCAMLALAYGKGSEEAKMLIRNLEQFLKTDDENGTAYLNIPTFCCFFWYGDENETLAAYLELLLREDPKSITAQKVANYLVTNIRNSPWRNSTRSLGAAIRALANYLTVSGEGKPDFTVTVRDGAEEHKFTFTPKNTWKNEGPALFFPAEKLKTGKHTIELGFSGSGAVYWNGMLNYFSLEDKIEPAGLEMKIQRNCCRLVPDTDASALLAGKQGAAVRENTLKYKRILLADGDTVNPGDLVEVELISTAKNDYDYVVFQDSMPAGFEYDSPVSGWIWSQGAPMYAEYKERGVKFYLRNMARGQSNVFYRIRARLTGTVTALPARGYGLYASGLKCNGAQQVLCVTSGGKRA